LNAGVILSVLHNPSRDTQVSDRMKFPLLHNVSDSCSMPLGLQAPGFLNIPFMENAGSTSLTPIWLVSIFYIWFPNLPGFSQTFQISGAKTVL
jgi:hypothetical protein